MIVWRPQDRVSLLCSLPKNVLAGPVGARTRRPGFSQLCSGYLLCCMLAPYCLGLFIVACLTDGQVGRANTVGRLITAVTGMVAEL